MEPLLIEGKINTPSVNFNSDSGLLNIEGRSIPENPVKFYLPIEDWIVNYLLTNPSEISPRYQQRKSPPALTDAPTKN